MQIPVLRALCYIDLEPFNFSDVNIWQLWLNCRQVHIAD